MTFLAPLFLVGLIGLAIPVILHLIQKERKNVVQFPSLMFLRRIPYQSVRRRRIRHWFLLMMRLAALALIVLAFSRPFIRRAEIAAGASGAREVVVLLDRSYSMGYGGKWSQAVAAAQQTINSLGPNDRGSVVLFGSNTEVALRSAADRGRLLAAIAGVQPGASATRFGPALKLAGSILSESALPRREAVLISDFQRSGWQGSEGVRLPDGAVLTPVSITDSGKTNLAIVPVALQNTEFESQHRVTVTTGAVNHTDAPVSNVEITLEIGGRAIQTRRISVAANGSSSTTFDPVTVAERNIRGTVRLADDALARDNVFHFVVSPEDPVKVIIGEGSGAQRNTSLYLARAVAVSETPRIDATIRQADSLSNEDLATAAVVIVNDAPIAQTTAERLQRFVERGGGLFLVLGERATWPSVADILPGLPGAAVDRSRGTPARLGALEYGHPLFEVFRGPRTGDFASARFYSFRSITPAPPAAKVQTLARFDDGQPALLERRSGNGRVLVWTSTLDTAWTDLALKPVFVPFVHRVVRYLGAYREPRPWRTVGDVVDPVLYPTGLGTRAGAASQSPTRASDVSRVALTPGGERISLDGDGPEVLELAEQGFYEFRAQGRDSELPVVVASNVDLKESDLASLDPQEIVAAAMGRAGGPAAGPAAPPTDEAQESAQRVWWYLLFAGLALLGLETIVANRLTV
jgi:Aerotolerance regulator N-terminal/von Willebrand factor type A domain